MCARLNDDLGAGVKCFVVALFIETSHVVYVHVDVTY